MIAPPPSPAPSLQSSDRDLEKLEAQLPPVDGGAAAWKFLFGAFMIEAFTFGMINPYSILPYVGRTDLSIIGTLGTAFYFLGGPLATYLIRRYRRWQQEAIWVGLAISIIGLATSSWAPDFGTLVATQGVIFGLGLPLMVYPIFSMMNEWFVDRRGLALGIMCAATGFSGLFCPFVLELLLNKYGPSATLRLSAVALALLCGPILPFLKPRYPKSHNETTSQGSDFSFLKMPLFYFFALAGLLQGLGFYFPTIYLPSYATSLGYSDAIGALLLMICSLGQLFGQLAFGYWSDMRIKRFWMDERVPVEILVFISPFVSGISILAMWGVARSLPLLVVFAMFYGFFAGGFAVLWARMGTTLSPNPALALATLSIFACLKGIGNVVTGPVSSALVNPDVALGEYGIGRFSGIVMYSGACMMASAAVMVVWCAGRQLVRACKKKGEFCGCPK
ncbi:MAG: hypothetical protein Q9201_000106 [Fulgogasparrea decipioides]